MTDYELVTIPNVGNPTAGMLCMTVSESRVGLFMPVLEALDRPERIQIHRGVRKNEGKLVVEGTDEECYGSILVNYDRKRINFYNRAFVELCKEMIGKYGKGKFAKGVFFTVRGKVTEDGTVEFDFHDVMYREVKSFGKRGINKKKPARKGKKAATDGFNMNFSMPNLGAVRGF